MYMCGNEVYDSIWMEDNKADELLRNVEGLLVTAKYGLEDLTVGLPPRRLAGLQNLVVFGRAVTSALQKLRSIEPDFDRWYEKYRQEMETDELMKYFYELRSEILKEGTLKTAVRVDLKEMKFPEDLSRFLRPPNAKGFFIGDRFGGSGWEVQLANGSLDKYYVELPYDIGSVTLQFPDPPRHHKEQEIKDKSIEALGRLYFDYLSRMVGSARDRFSTRS